MATFDISNELVVTLKYHYDKNSLVEYGCWFVAKFSRWLLYAKKMNFRCLGNDFFCVQQKIFMFNKWFLYV